MKKLKLYTTALFLGVMTFSWSQQESSVYQFNDLMLIYNPAYAGTSTQANITTAYVKEWAGVALSPETKFLSYDKALGKGLGLGLSVINDNTFVETQNLLSLDFSFKIQVSEETDLFFGLRATGMFYNLNASGLETLSSVSDPSLVDISLFKPNMGFGFHLKNHKWNMALSIPRFFNTSRISEENGIALLSTGKTHVYGSASYNFALDGANTFVLRPGVFFRYAGGIPISTDLNATLIYNQKVEFGATYRVDSNFAALYAVQVSPKFKLGVAYGMSARDLQDIDSNYEFMLKYSF